MEKELLFIKRLKKETFKFYRTKGECVEDIFYSVEIPKGVSGRADCILFTSSKIPYTLHQPCPKWILNACKKAFIQKGYFE